MRGRWLKPDFFTDKKIAALGPVVALVYEALWCMADDGGTAKGDADVVKATMFYRWSAIGVPEISGAILALSESGRISTYAVGDDQYHVIVKWSDHQQVHKPSKFRHPKPPQAITQSGAGGVPHSAGNGNGSGVEIPAIQQLDSKTVRQLGIPGAVRNDTGTPADAEEAWDHIVALMPAWHRREITAERHALLPEGVRRGLSKIGGFQAISQTSADKMVWVKKDFMAAYNG